MVHIIIIVIIIVFDVLRVPCCTVYTIAIAIIIIKQW